MKRPTNLVMRAGDRPETAMAPAHDRAHRDPRTSLLQPSIVAGRLAVLFTPVNASRTLSAMQNVVRLSVAARLALVARDIKVSHSVFALPFALLACYLAEAAAGRSPDAATLLLIVLCMVMARTVAMTMNRWADSHLDANNPRTAGRAIPSGQLTRPFMLAVAACCALGLVLAAAGFWFHRQNPWPVLLSPVVLAWLVGYSFTKRFTWLCHLSLGAALALSPLAAVLAVRPDYLGQAEPYLLAMMVMCWVAGFDVLYALQDVGSDRATGVLSIPASLGVTAALWIAAALHLISVAMLVMLLPAASGILDVGFATVVLLVAVLLGIEHAVVWRTGTRHIHLTFFTLNGLISLLLGGLGIADALGSIG